MNEKLRDLIDRIKELFDKFLDFVSDMWENNRTIFLAVCALIICIPLILIVVIGMGKTDSETVVKRTTVDEYIYLPEEPGLGKDYVLSRKKQSQWNEEEAKRWFIEPDGEMLDNMRTVNDNLINDLLEAVP
ncbi:MAG: hypothetical protein K5751_00780 [Treponemataceae bacterium]|nr:hypothetical protein [Treponemataceae bacterium]